MEKLARKVAVITGGARGIGKEIALTFAGEGADIVIGDIIEMETVAQDIKSLGREVITIKTDVTQQDRSPEPDSYSHKQFQQGGHIGK